MREGFVYLFAETTDGVNHTGLYKIGKTKRSSSEDRKRNYQAGNARPLILLYEAYVSDCQYWETTIQTYWKEQGKHHYTRGGGDEWFNFDEDDVEYTIAWLYQLAHPEPVYDEPEPESEYSYNPSYEDDGIPGWVYVVGIMVFFVVIAMAGSGIQQPGTDRGGKASIGNITIGNPYRVKCIGNKPGVHIRKKPSLRAAKITTLRCNKDVVKVTGQPVLTDEYWYPVQTEKGQNGFIAKPGIDP